MKETTLLAACRRSGARDTHISGEMEELPACTETAHTACQKERAAGLHQERPRRLRPLWRSGGPRQSCQAWLLALALCGRAAAGSVLQRSADEPFHWTAPTVVLAVVLFLVAGLCEIGGGWLVWQVGPHPLCSGASWDGWRFLPNWMQLMACLCTKRRQAPSEGSPQCCRRPFGRRSQHCGVQLGG